MKLYQGYKGNYYIRYTKPDGRPTTIGTGTNNLDEANKFFQKFVKNTFQTTSSVSRMRCIDLFKKWKELLKGVKCSNLYVFTPFLQYFGDKRVVDTITKLDVENYKKWRQNCYSSTVSGKLISLNTINLELRCFNSIFNKSVGYGFITQNPFQKTKMFKAVEKQNQYIPDGMLKQIISSIQHDTTRNVVMFCALTGCRIAETLNLTWENVDLVNKTIHIADLFDDNKKVIFRTKTRKNREIPINDTLFQMLCDMKRVGGYVFGKSGVPYTYTHIYKIFKTTVINLGYPFLSVHSLRHTFITNLIKKGVPINYVKELAGHSDISTTLKYVHTSVDDLRNSVNLISL